MHIIIIPGWREGSCGSKTLRWELRGSGEQEGQALAAALSLQPLQMQHLSLSQQPKEECWLPHVL